MGPRQCNLKSQLDDRELAGESADLNLKLMRWRAIPELNTDMLQKTKVLLLGAGTLGCHVARTLMGWGVRNITFVDSGKVSMSNPVRQSLFNFEDCLNGGKYKAEAAAAACKAIFPVMNASGHVFSIPMPGHPVSKRTNQEEVDTAKLEELIKGHDVVYLLTDTRESRWLPTLICSAENKMLINIALGFASWLVVRHGKGVTGEGDNGADTVYERSLKLDADRLGCYFCTDVVAPTNSMRDRTLDQQCTVTRPGLAPIASAMGVEVMVGLLHRKSATVGSTLGSVPHTIRGNLGDWEIKQFSNTAVPFCTACSDIAIEKWRSEKFAFVERVAEDAMYLEDLTGLTKLKEEVEQIDIGACDDDDDDW